jgi:hypothetical protein
MVFLACRWEPDPEYDFSGCFRVSNYSNKNAVVNLLGIVTGLCLLFVLWSVARLLGKKAVLSDSGRQNDAGNNHRKKIDCTVIEK